jgi:hypothetical protein
MLTLSYGFKKPQSGDKGPVVFPAMELNVQKINDHTHDGTNSAKLPAQNFTTTTQTIPHASWSGAGLPAGHFKQNMSIPAGFTFDANVISFRDSVGIIYPTIVRTENTH